MRMELSALAANAALSMLFGAKAREKADAPGFAAPERPADFARPAPILPTSGANISMESVLFLQAQAEPADALKGPTATELFLEEIQKDPIERMREQIMEELGLSEESLAQMSPEERRAAEATISAMIEEKLRRSFGAERGETQTAAEYLTQALRA
jgi:hypothetical protein